MSETHTSTVEYQTHPAHLEKAVQEMLDLRWPEYTDETQRLETMAERIEAAAAANGSVLDDYYSDSAQATNVNGFYLPHLSAMRDIQKRDAMDPREIRETAAEFHAQKCRELTTLLANGPFAACNPVVAEAFRSSMDEAITTLTSALSRQEDGASKYDHDIHDYDAGLTLQALEYTLAGTAVQLGALDHHEAHAYYATQTYHGVLYGSQRTRAGGQKNSYGIRYLETMEWPEDDVVDPESPAILDIVANPGMRVSFGTTFLSSSLRERFTTSTKANDRKYMMSDFSIRIDVDPDSPTGFSLDIGRDQRDIDQFSRTPDAAGASAQLIRPLQGSHFTAAFRKVSQKDMAEFTRGIGEFLKADAEMDRLDTALKNRTTFNISHLHPDASRADRVTIAA